MRSRVWWSRRPGTLQLLAGLLVLASIVWISFSTRGEDAADATSASPVRQFEVAERATVEQFAATTLDGENFRSTDLTGQVAVYNVWGSWCVPCRTEASELVSVAERYAGQVQFVGINMRDGIGAAQAFERRFKVPYPSLRSDDSGTAILAFGGTLTAAAVPATVVVDREGRVAARILGPTTALTLSELIREVLAEQRTPAVHNSTGAT